MTGGAQRSCLGDRRWHFQHGPIDCIVGADGDEAAIERAIDRAWARFGGVLAELVGELPLLRTDLASAAGTCVAPRGPIARRMAAACRAHATDGRFITAMAAVAGSVAEELIAYFDDPRIERAFVNNGGDIALHLGRGAAYEIGWVADPDVAIAVGLRGAIERAGTASLRADPRRADVPLAGSFRIAHGSGVRGVATSGWRGRSFSLGIVDSCTVLAATASAADAAATVIANAVNLDDARIHRAPASSLRDDSDLGERLVTCGVPLLPDALVAAALDAGVARARVEIAAGRVVAAALCLQGQVRTCAADAALLAAARVQLDAVAPRGGASVRAARPAFDTLAAGARAEARDRRSSAVVP